MVLQGFDSSRSFTCAESIESFSATQLCQLCDRSTLKGHTQVDSQEHALHTRTTPTQPDTHWTSTLAPSCKAGANFYECCFSFIDTVPTPKENPFRPHPDQCSSNYSAHLPRRCRLVLLQVWRRRCLHWLRRLDRLHRLQRLHWLHRLRLNKKCNTVTATLR